MDYLLGLDLGGTKIEAAILDAQSFSVLDRLRIPTEADKGYDRIVQNIVNIIGQISDKNGLSFSKVGIGTPGTLEPQTHTMKNCNTTALNGKPLKKDLEALLNKEVLLSNDANCFAVAEASMGIVPDLVHNPHVVFGIIMGTGVGGGVVVHSKVIGGLQGIGGEWGHNFLDESGGLCYCGKIGCVEKIISGPALESYYYSLSGQHLSLKDIVQNYRNQNDNFADLTMERLFENFAKAVSVVINILDPDIIVIGGGVGNIDEIYTLGVERVKKYIFNRRLDTLFAKPKLGDSAGVYGAALL
ncbi:MAG: Fructokinase [Bacteroidota bacterium]|jgi:predicted NBD/HSP70 family sugar kinase